MARDRDRGPDRFGRGGRRQFQPAYSADGRGPGPREPYPAEGRGAGPPQLRGGPRGPRWPRGQQQQHELTLQEEARQTSYTDHGQQSFWGRGSKLRDQPVSFQSSGTATLAKLPEATADPAKAGEGQGSAPEQEPGVQAGRAAGLDNNGQASRQAAVVPAPTPAPTATMPAAHQHQATRRVDVRPSRVLNRQPDSGGGGNASYNDDGPETDSSAEIITFKGRRRQPQQQAGNAKAGNDGNARAGKARAEEARAEEARPIKLDPIEPDANAPNLYRQLQHVDPIQDYIANMEQHNTLAELGDPVNMLRLPMLAIDGIDDDDDGGASRGDGQDDHEQAADAASGLAGLVALRRSRGADNELDVMDKMDNHMATRGARGGGRRQIKQRGGWIPDQPDCDDDEDERNLAETQERIRLKKAEHRREREQLRATGQLGKQTAQQDDLMSRYQNGMTFDQIGKEFQDFMIESKSTLIFPPLDQIARKAVHQVASRLRIASKSMGDDAERRRPVLYRRKNTLPYSADGFDRCVSEVYRTFFFRQDARQSRWGIPYFKSQSAGQGRSAGVRDGEVVGGSLPELASDNRGRAMLEKMGWSSGTALGGVDNKGILLPVTQVVRKTKAGLGVVRQGRAVWIPDDSSAEEPAKNEAKEKVV